MRVIVFSGAGISKESGLDTFRKGGVWDGVNVNDVANVSSWWAGPESQQRMLDFYNHRREQCHKAEPNGAHLALAELEKAGHHVTIITQNVDNLHERAGSKHVIHIHGELMKARPDNNDHPVIDWEGDLNLGDLHDGVQLRPHIVWFGEGLPHFDEAYTTATEPDVDVLVIVGTTLEVSPANLCAFHTRARKVYVIDPEPPKFGITSARHGGLSPHPDCTVFQTTAVDGVRKAVDEIAHLAR
jgi:NAD-dependent deacetylase